MKIIELTIVQCVCAKVRDGKMRWIMITKTTMGIIFNLQNSHLMTDLTDRGSLLSKRLKSACGKSSSCRFSVTAARYAITKATEYVAFGFYFHRKVSFLLGRGGGGDGLGYFRHFLRKTHAWPFTNTYTKTSDPPLHLLQDKNNRKWK